MNSCIGRILSALPLLALAIAVQAKEPPKPKSDQPAIVSESDAVNYWQPAAPMSEPALASPAPDQSEDVCVSLGYMVQLDGTTSDFALLRSWSSKHAKGLPDSADYSIYSRTAVAASMQRKFNAAPAMGNKPVSIFTATTFAFPAQAGTDRESVRAHCAIKNLPDFVRRAQEDSYRRRGDLNKASIDRRPATDAIRAVVPNTGSGRR